MWDVILMNKIDRVKLRDNILYFGKLKGLKIGDIEKGIGVRLGMVSRWANKKPDVISLDIVYNISTMLDIPIDVLITADTSELRKEQELIELKEQRDELDERIKRLEGGSNE